VEEKEKGERGLKGSGLVGAVVGCDWSKKRKRTVKRLKVHPVLVVFLCKDYCYVDYDVDSLTRQL
jgi:hypothetical protein